MSSKVGAWSRGELKPESGGKWHPISIPDLGDLRGG